MKFRNTPKMDTSIDKRVRRTCLSGWLADGDEEADGRAVEGAAAASEVLWYVSRFCKRVRGERNGHHGFFGSEESEKGGGIKKTVPQDFPPVLRHRNSPAWRACPQLRCCWPRTTTRPRPSQGGKGGAETGWWKKQRIQKRKRKNGLKCTLVLPTCVSTLLLPFFFLHCYFPLFGVQRHKSLWNEFSPRDGGGKERG